MPITRLDEYPVHQVPEPLHVPATGDRNAYDRYWFNGYDRDAAFTFGVALGLYPNRDVMDGSLSVLVDGVQHSFHGSRRAPLERTDTTVGPLRIEIVEPLRRLRVVLDPNDTGLACDLTFSARTPAMQENRATMRVGSRVMLDLTRFTQLGVWDGRIEVPGRSLVVDRSRVVGTRDRSWGVRPVGEPEGGAPMPFSTILWLWAPVHFDDHAVLWGSFEGADGRPWHASGKRVPTFDPSDAVPPDADAGVEELTLVRHDLKFTPGTRYVSGGELRMARASGEELRLSLEPVARFAMAGLGYGHPTWGHGTWHGDSSTEGERWVLADEDPMAVHLQHVQQVCRFREGDHQGVGVLEQLFFGPHGRYGFGGLLDPAP